MTVLFLRKKEQQKTKNASSFEKLTEKRTVLFLRKKEQQKNASAVPLEKGIAKQ